mgnify:CR=1 FL=1
MNNKIYIEEDILQSKINQLYLEKQNMEKALNNIKSDANTMIEYWSGNSGEEAYVILNNYTRSFKGIIDKLESNIKFIENVLQAYKQIDSQINKKMEENANIEVY